MPQEGIVMLSSAYKLGSLGLVNSSFGLACFCKCMKLFGTCCAVTVKNMCGYNDFLKFTENPHRNDAGKKHWENYMKIP
jgi:hypothetical protein